MTSLDLSDATTDRRDAQSLLGKINWAIVVPWLVVSLGAATGVYQRFLTMEDGRQRDSAAIERLTTQVQQMKYDQQDMKADIAVLTAIVQRMEARQNQQGRR